MQADRVLVLVIVATTIACTRRPSADLVLEAPEPTARDQDVGPAKGSDARIDGLCAHSFDVLADESPSLRSPAVEREFIDRCTASNHAKRSELGDQRWTQRAGCIEQAKTSEDIGRCDGRTPRSEPNPAVIPTGIDGRAVCQHVFDVMLKENPDMAAFFAPEQMGPIMDDCIRSIEAERLADPGKFERETSCLMAATTILDFESCGSD